MAAGPAASLGTLAGAHLTDEDEGLPCADFALLVPLKRSPEYGAIRPRVADPKPLDAWQLDGIHYFVFGLRREDGEAASAGPVALFTLRHGEPSPACAVIVTPGPKGERAHVVDLRQAGLGYTVHLSAGGPEARGEPA